MTHQPTNESREFARAAEGPPRPAAPLSSPSPVANLVCELADTNAALKRMRAAYYQLKDEMGHRVWLIETLRRWSRGDTHDLPERLRKMAFADMAALADWVEEVRAASATEMENT